MKQPIRLHKSRTNKFFLGVCGGIGESLNIDPTLIRVGLVLLSLFMPRYYLIIAYIVLGLVLPEK